MSHLKDGVGCVAGSPVAVPEEVIRRGAADRVARLALRLALTALRAAAPSVASDCSASTCRLLSGILRSAPIPRYVQLRA